MYIHSDLVHGISGFERRLRYDFPIKASIGCHEHSLDDISMPIIFGPHTCEAGAQRRTTESLSIRASQSDRGFASLPESEMTDVTCAQAEPISTMMAEKKECLQDKDLFLNIGILYL